GGRGRGRRHLARRRPGCGARRRGWRRARGRGWRGFRRRRRYRRRGRQRTEHRGLLPAAIRCLVPELHGLSAIAAALVSAGLSASAGISAVELPLLDGLSRPAVTEHALDGAGAATAAGSRRETG